MPENQIFNSLVVGVGRSFIECITDYGSSRNLMEKDENVTMIHYPNLHIYDYNTEDSSQTYEYSNWNLYSRYNLRDRAKIMTIEAIKTYTHWYDIYQMFPDFFTLDELYEKNISDTIVFKYFLVFGLKDEAIIDRFLQESKISINSKNKACELIFYNFLFEIDAKILATSLIEYKENDASFKEYHALDDKHNIEEVLDPSSRGTWNIPVFNFLVSHTPLSNLLETYELIDPYGKLRYNAYCAINNGKRLFTSMNYLGFDRNRLIENQERNNFNDPVYYPDIDSIMRSTWEANVARLLNHFGFEWMYEIERVEVEIKEFKKKLQLVGYLPDFKLTKVNTYIEVKGFWDHYSLDAYTAAKARYTDRLFIHIDSDIYYTLNKVYAETIPNWSNRYVNLKPSIVPVVGITLADRVPFVKRLTVGESIIFVRDYENAYDKNAIKALNLNGEMIGYVAKAWASIYAEKMDIGIKYDATVESIEPTVVKIKVIRSNPEDITLPEIFLVK